MSFVLLILSDRSNNEWAFIFYDFYGTMKLIFC